MEETIYMSKGQAKTKNDKKKIPQTRSHQKAPLCSVSRVGKHCSEKLFGGHHFHH